MSKGKMNPFGLNEAMVYVSTSWGLASHHRPSVQSVPLGLFCHESKAHDCSWLGRSGEWGWHLLSGLVVSFLSTRGWVVLGLVLRWRNRFHHSSDIRLVRGTELQSSAFTLFIWLTHRLSSGPGSWDLLCEGLGHPQYLLAALTVVTRAPNPATCFPGEVVDLVGWDWGWVPRGLH